MTAALGTGALVALAILAALLAPRAAAAVGLGLLHPLPEGWRAVSSSFGPRSHPSGSGDHFHNGTDYPAPQGTPVRAPEGGTVVAAWYDERNGNALRLQADSGRRWSFAHLDGVGVDEGERIERGQVIAWTGNTGSAYGANGGYHLHLGLYHRGAWVDPDAALSGVFA